MAKIFPSVRPSVSEKVSDAELAVYDSLAESNDKWLVIHSLWLKSHSRKLHAQADFILITENPVLILEV
jgi:cytosine/adenosine deaminase-related metal-dependent hydrolase